MKTTRRGWLTAFSSFIALPLLPKSGVASADVTPAPRTLVELFAGLNYRNTTHSRPGMEFWEETVRVPVTPSELQAREESLRDDLHYLRTRNAGYYVTQPFESNLRDIECARTILRHLPTGRPLSFRYAHGSTPGAARTVLPTLIFHTEQPLPPGIDIVFELPPPECRETQHLYLQAYCLERLAPRTFRLDRITEIKPLSAR
jgi:hypothetical protein